MFSGYNYHDNPPLIANGILTNYQDFTNGKDDSSAWDRFEMNYWTENRPGSGRPYTMIQRIGTWLAMTEEDEIVLRRMLLDSKPLSAIADKAVTVVRSNRRATSGKENHRQTALGRRTASR